MGDTSKEFTHKRDPQCHYFEELSKHCTMMPSQNRQQQQQHDNRLNCKVLRKLMRQCPRGPVEEVERIETNTMEDASQGSRIGGGLRGFYKEFDDGMDTFGGFPSSKGVDPFDAMRRSIDEMFSEHHRVFGDFFNNHPNGPFRPDDGTHHGHGSHQPAPGFHKHRYTKPEESKRRWERPEQ